ncbi:hypothetical protein [Pedobacter insulae]|uniref:Uncharacterized protein n=1 Tax=Pedobacter insulae TaxID=414048 RepID=A0A1I2ZHJ4_9SPHI|nr:hypothetical protein [Pedobacter insulae]SFH37317.1 hypothetical protein SAMN04489864_11036 [Pedobacter insulae]
MENKNLQLVYEALLSAPGMNETVRIDLRPSRRIVLLLSQVVELGLLSKGGNGIAEAVSEESRNELKELIESCIEKSQLTEFIKNLKGLQHIKG